MNTALKALSKALYKILGQICTRTEIEGHSKCATQSHKRETGEHAKAITQKCHYTLDTCDKKVEP